MNDRQEDRITNNFNRLENKVEKLFTLSVIGFGLVILFVWGILRILVAE